MTGDGTAQPRAALIETDNVTRTLTGAVPVTLIRDASLAVGAGEFIAITGPSGSGKSSLLYLLGLLDHPSSGAIRFEGRDTGALTTAECARLRLEKIGFVFQFHFLLPEFSVLGNVLIPMRRLGRGRDSDMRERAVSLLEDFGLGAHMDKRPDQLSGGERQRAAIARALANDPPIVLADEPTGNLDRRNGGMVFDIFERLVDVSGRTVIAVTHDPELAARTGRRLHLLDGRIVEDEKWLAAAAG